MVPENTEHLSHIFYIKKKSQFKIKRDHFFLVFPTCVQFCIQIAALNCSRAYSADTFKSLTRKVSPHAHHNPDRIFSSHQQLIDIND